MSYAGQSVIRGGREIRHIHDGKSQGREWVRPNIFAPYETEFHIGAQFGTLWDAWLIEMDGAVAALRERYGTPNGDEPEVKFEKAAEFMTHGQVADEER